MTSVGSPRVRIRPARPEDAEGILDCLRVAFAPYRRAYTPAAFRATVLTGPMLARRYRSMHLLVACEGPRVVGTVAIKPISRGHAHLRGMAVVPAYQGRGLAARLLRAAVRHARARGAHRLTLETTEPLQRAARFYARHGFRSTGRYRTWGGMRLLSYELRIGSGPGSPSATARA